jgi:hypothetical protein
LPNVKGLHLLELLESATTPADLLQVEYWIAEEDQFDAEGPDGDQEADAARSHSDRVNAAQNERTALSQEIGPLPEIRDPRRRESCRRDLKKFALTYMKAACYRGLSPYQIEMCDAFQSVILNGGKRCRAVRRGGLKSTLARVATAWAVLYGHRKFPVLVGATDDKSNEHRDNLFKTLESSRELRDDFPELIPLLFKRKNPKKTLRLNGEVLTVSHKDDRGSIIFPSIAGTDCSEARVAPYSLMSTDVSGLSFVDDTGKVIRPDLLIFDDVQTPQSAKSPLQTDSRENKIDTTFMGLAGLGETIAAIMVCTVREVDDLTMRYCDRERHADWDGSKYPVLIHEPTNKARWKEYEDLLRDGDKPEDGFAMATAFYRDNRADLDEGGAVSWEEDKPEEFISALQWCMTIRSLQPDFFRCELQQEGAPPASGLTQLNGVAITRRLSGIPRGIVPAKSQYLTAFVDSSDHVLWWMVVAWQKDFTGWIVDYGTWPDQGRREFYKSELPHTIESKLPGRSWEEAFVHAHNHLDAMLLQDWRDEIGVPRQMDLILKDWSDGGQKRLIESQVSLSANKNRIRPSKGFGPKPGKKPVHYYGDPNKDRNTGSHWVERRSQSPVCVDFDANQFKSIGARRLETIPGAPSAVLLPGSHEHEHQMLAEHFTAEQSKTIVYDGSAGVTWEALPGRDNDWLDAYVGNCVAASMLGVCVPGTEVKQKERRTFVMPVRR